MSVARPSTDGDRSVQARVLFGSGSNTSSVAGRARGDGAGEGTGNRLTDGDTTIENFGGIDGDRDVLTWILIAGDRRLVAGAFVLGIVLVLLLAVQLGVVAVGPASSIRTLLSSGITSGLLALITVSLSINQLLLSRVFGSPGGLEDRLSGTLDLRERVEEVGDLPVSPNHPVAFLGVHGPLLADRAVTLRSGVDGDGRGDEELGEFTDLVEAYGDHLGTFRDSERGTFDALAAILGSEYADLLQESRRIERTRAGGLSSTGRRALEDIETLLRSIAVLRQFFKTASIQQDLARLSQLVAYSGLVALVTTYLLTLVYHSSSGATLPGGVLEWLAPLGLAVTVVPLAFLISYTLRVATISRYTVSVGPFVPPEERFDQ